MDKDDFRLDIVFSNVAGIGKIPHAGQADVHETPYFITVSMNIAGADVIAREIASLDEIDYTNPSYDAVYHQLKELLAYDFQLVAETVGDILKARVCLGKHGKDNESREVKLNASAPETI